MAPAAGAGNGPISSRGSEDQAAVDDAVGDKAVAARVVAGEFGTGTIEFTTEVNNARSRPAASIASNCVPTIRTDLAVMRCTIHAGPLAGLSQEIVTQHNVPQRCAAQVDAPVDVAPEQFEFDIALSVLEIERTHDSRTMQVQPARIKVRFLAGASIAPLIRSASTLRSAPQSLISSHVGNVPALRPSGLPVSIASLSAASHPWR